MALRARRQPQRPIAFWTVFCAIAALSVAAVAALALDTRPDRPIVVAGRLATG
jgi:hypothetical protein